VGYTHYDRLPAFDAAFLKIENENVHMHVGAVVVFDAAPLTAVDGTLELDVIRRSLEGALNDTPRFRQKLVDIPLFDHPVWVDDDRFNLDYHFRHTALPQPGGERQLKRLAGRILSQKLDRGKPVWELWVVEGLEGGRFALIAKAHHCMVDGVAGLDLLTSMLRLEPTSSLAAPEPWIPRPAPSRQQLMRDELARRAAFPVSMVRSAAGIVSDPERITANVQRSARGLAEILTAGLSPSARTPLNTDVGPYRRFDWTTTAISEIREIRDAFGGTLNDVVLTCAAGAIGDFMRRHNFTLEDEPFRVQVPMNIRGTDETGGPGNRVALLMAELPIEETDDVARLDLVREATTGAKGSGQRDGLEVLGEFSDRVYPDLLVMFGRIAIAQRSFNIVITNIPGPRDPAYLGEAQMQEIYPLVPLAEQQGLGIALFSYNGDLHWGFHADWDTIPELHDLVDGVDAHFGRLLDAARR
jgi:WS/DGAT/MGAT family acyltransferase